MKQRKKQLLTFLLLAAAILAFCLLWQPRAAGGVEISMTAEVSLPDYISPADLEAKTKMSMTWLDIVSTPYQMMIGANGCYSPSISFGLKNEKVLALRLGCRGCQLVGKIFKCSQQIQEEVTEK